MTKNDPLFKAFTVGFDEMFNRVQSLNTDYSKAMYEAIKKAGGNPQLFIYEGINHNSWDNAFEEPDYISWMMNQLLR